MDNYDAVSYAQVALINLQKNNTPITYGMMLSEMYYLFDIHSEYSIHDELLRLTDFKYWKIKHNLL